jgi:cyanoexosortase B-associated protein
MLSLSKSVQLPFAKLVLALLLLALVGLGAMPGYLSGQWRWTAPPKLTALADLKTIRKTGLTLPDWPTLEQATVQIGEHQWSRQSIKGRDNTPATLLLFTQNGPKDQPQVEWLDINGTQNWKTDSYQDLGFKIANPPTQVTARWFRGWTKKQTYTVLQWYAWPTGGNHAPYHWFIADRLAQWHNQRMPWVAVSILLPIEPLDDITKYRSQVEALAQTVQTALLASALRP